VIDEDIVIGWRAIGRLFGRSERHARRLHRRYGLPVFKLGKSVYCSRIAVGLWSLNLAAKQRADLIARAAAVRPQVATMDAFIRAQAGQMSRARLAMAVDQQSTQASPALAKRTGVAQQTGWNARLRG
jgi:hypothetical protein